MGNGCIHHQMHNDDFYLDTFSKEFPRNFLLYAKRKLKSIFKFLKIFKQTFTYLCVRSIAINRQCMIDKFV
jgi:hypothetical protein